MSSKSSISSEAPRKDHSDPLWDTRRTLLKQCLIFCGVFLLAAMLLPESWMPADRLDALSGLAAAVASFAAFVLTAYMGITEYGRIKGVHGETETITSNAPTAKQTTVTKVTKPTPPVTVEGDAG